MNSVAQASYPAACVDCRLADGPGFRFRIRVIGERPVVCVWHPGCGTVAADAVELPAGIRAVAAELVGSAWEFQPNQPDVRLWGERVADYGVELLSDYNAAHRLTLLPVA